MANIDDVKIENGQIKLPYNFNDEKYVIGIERKKDNKLVAGKTFIPIRDSKPSYILEITPITTPTFHFKKNGDVYEIVKNEVHFNVNFIIDEILLPTSDYEINVDWDNKYTITNSSQPTEIILSLKNDFQIITKGSKQYEILENKGSFSDELNVTIINGGLVYNTVLNIIFQKSYFETISLYDSIDITQRDDNTDVKKNVITIDGYYNDNKVNKEKLNLMFNKSNNNTFTTVASTMGYINLEKNSNDWFLTHHELSETENNSTPLKHHYVIVDNNNRNDELFISDRQVTSGSTLLLENEIRCDISGTVYSGATAIINNSGVRFNNTIYVSPQNIIKYINSNQTFFDGNIFYDKVPNSQWILNISERKIKTSNGEKSINELTSGTTYTLYGGIWKYTHNNNNNTGLLQYSNVQINIDYQSGNVLFKTSNKVNFIYYADNNNFSIIEDENDYINISRDSIKAKYLKGNYPLAQIDFNTSDGCYTWYRSKYIEYSGYTITNENCDKLFYYCDNSGNIYYNKEKIKYVKDENGLYYDLENGRRLIIRDDNRIIDTQTKYAIPSKNKFFDKFNNIKLDKNTSYDFFNKVEKDVNNKIKKLNDTSKNISFPSDELYRTPSFDFSEGKIYDYNGRLLSNLSLSSINIEGGLIVCGNTIYSGTTKIATITDNGITMSNSFTDITLSADKKTLYYRNKKAYNINDGSFYLEENIKELSNTGFTLENGLIVTPPENSSATKSIGTNANYSSGVNLKDPNTNLTVLITYEKQNGEGKWSFKTQIPPEETPETPIFDVDNDGFLIYNGITIGDINGILYNVRNPRDFINSDIPKYHYVSDTSEDGIVKTILDTSGKETDIEVEDKEDVYYDTHNISDIKKIIPDLLSYIQKCNSNQNGLTLNVIATYDGIMGDNKNYTVIDGGNNNSSYKIKVEPQFITTNMIDNGSTITAKIVNNNDDHIPYATYSSNAYKFTYTYDTSDETEITGDTFNLELTKENPIFNEIKFSLYCNTKLVKQEIVEVLGENKLISIVEYVDVSNSPLGVRYTIKPTTNDYYGTNITWKNSRGNIITALTITSSSTKEVISGYCNDILVYEQTILPLKKGDKGSKGDSGQRGKLLYPAGRWNSSTTYYGTDEEKTPFVLYNDKYYVLTATTDIIGDEYTPGGKGWAEMAQYEALYTKLLVAENGIVGGSVYNGDYVFSKNGISGDTIVSGNDDYSGFNQNIVEKIFSGGTIDNQFIPNYLVDFNNGRAWFGAGNTTINNNGSISTNLLCEEIKEKVLENLNNINDGFDIKNMVFIGPPMYEGEENSHTYSGVTAMQESINELNCYIIDGPLSSSATKKCSLEKIYLIDIKISDENVVKPNVFYKGNIYIDPECSLSKIFRFNFYDENDEGYLILSGGGIITYLFKWDGRYAVDNDGKRIKTGKIVLIGDYESILILRIDSYVTNAGLKYSS